MSRPVAHRSYAPLEGRGVAAVDDDVEHEAERPLGPRQREIELRDEALACVFIGNGMEDRIVREQWIARKVHLRHETREKVRAEYREMDVRGTPRVVVIAPGIRARLDRREDV